MCRATGKVFSMICQWKELFTLLFEWTYSSDTPAGKPDVAFYLSDVIMIAMTSPITSPTTVYSIVYSDADRRKHQSSASLAFVGGIHRWPVNSPHKWPVTRKMFPFDDVIMCGTYVTVINRETFYVLQVAVVHLLWRSTPIVNIIMT